MEIPQVTIQADTWQNLGRVYSDEVKELRLVTDEKSFKELQEKTFKRVVGALLKRVTSCYFCETNQSNCEYSRSFSVMDCKLVQDKGNDIILLKEDAKCEPILYQLYEKELAFCESLDLSTFETWRVSVLCPPWQISLLRQPLNNEKALAKLEEMLSQKADLDDEKKANIMKLARNCIDIIIPRYGGIIVPVKEFVDMVNLNWFAGIRQTKNTI
jgi:hypothetical protein